MISILIPVYNYDVVPLAEEIHAQATRLNIPFEILIYDDGSKSELNKKNNTLNSLEGCVFNILDINIGRSALRNLLATNAKFEHLLFVDAGTHPKENFFLRNYLQFFGKEMVVGGMTHLHKPPKKPYKLRWLYTKKRESNFKNGKVFCSSNFMIKKNVFECYPFDQTITTYGYEDVVFFENLKKNGVPITFIENPVIHDAGDDAHTFLLKTETAIRNLKMLTASNKLSIHATKTTRLSNALKKLKLDGVTAFIFNKTKSLLIKNLESSRPSIHLFNFYRVGYYCTLKNPRP